MNRYKVYTPWDSVIIEAETEEEAKKLALWKIQSEVKSARHDELDVDQIDE